MTHMNRSDFAVKPLPVYSEIVCDFLQDLSGALRRDAEAKTFPDIQTFAFWCRRANISKLKQERGVHTFV